MRIAVGSDERNATTDAIAAWLRAHGHEIVAFGAMGESDADRAWPSVGRAVGGSVASGEAAFGVVCCWTGTGVTIAANKVRGVRAALCVDAQTARGAREWNDANVLSISLRLATPAIAEELLEAWFSAAVTPDPAYRAMIDDAEGAIQIQIPPVTTTYSSSLPWIFER